MRVPSSVTEVAVQEGYEANVILSVCVLGIVAVDEAVCSAFNAAL